MASETMTKLAKALAHPERETRVAGLDVVRTFLTRRKKSALEVDDLRKLWKGFTFARVFVRNVLSRPRRAVLLHVDVRQVRASARARRGSGGHGAIADAA